MVLFPAYSKPPPNDDFSWAGGGARYRVPQRKKPPPVKKVAPAKRAYNPLAPIANPQAYASAYVKAQLSPLIADLTAKYTSARTNDAQNIQNYTAFLASQLAQYAPAQQANYAGAQQAQAALDAATAGQLSGAGSSLASDLGAKLAAINASPEVMQNVAGGIQQAGQGAAGAEYAKGSASLASLIAGGAAATDYAQKLPGIGALGGLQALRENTLKSQADLADQISQLQSQAPGLIADILDQTLNRNYQIAAANREYDYNQTADQQKYQQWVIEQITKGQADTSLATYRKQQLAIQQQNANTSASRAATAAAAQANAAAAREWKQKHPTEKSRTYNDKMSAQRGILVDSQGRPFLDDNGNTIPYKKPKKATATSSSSGGRMP